MPEGLAELPKFVQMANRIRDQILSGALRPGDEVPSERALAAEWHVARPTAARALQELRMHGLVDARQGSGSYVRERVQLSRRARDRYARSRSIGRVYADGEWAEIVSATMAQVAGHIGEAMGIDAGETAVRRHRITGDAEGPSEVSTSWFPPDVASVAPRLLSRDRIREGTLAYVEASTGRRAVVGRDQMSARLAHADECLELNLDDPTAVMVVMHVALDLKGRVLEVAEAVYPSGRWMFDQEYPLTP